MPASFTIDVARRAVYSRGWGVLVDDDLRETQRGLREAVGFESDFCQLYDFSDVTEVRVTGEGLREMALQSPFDRNARRAVVVDSHVAYGMVRLFQIVGDRETPEFQIFRHREDALRWLESGNAV
jgi:hypothetical protein